MIRYSDTHPSQRQAPPCRRHWIDRMAMDMRKMTFAGETVNAESLRQRGYSDAVIDRLADDAIAKARRDSVRNISGERNLSAGTARSARRAATKKEARP